MKKYESVIIVNPNLDEEALKALEDKFTGLINGNGKVESFEKKSKKRLAYDIKKHKEAYYFVINFEAEPSLIAEFQRVLRITDSILKFIVIDATK